MAQFACTSYALPCSVPARRAALPGFPVAQSHGVLGPGARPRVLAVPPEATMQTVPAFRWCAPRRVRRSDHTTAAGAWAVAPDKRGVLRWRNPSLLATSRRPPALAQSSASTGSVQELPAELHGAGRSATMTEGITCRLNGLIRRRRRKKPGAPAAVEVVSCAANAFSSGSAAAQHSRTAIGRHTRRSQRSERACSCRLRTLGPPVAPPRAEIQPFFRCFRVVLRPGSPPRRGLRLPALAGVYTAFILFTIARY